jgi:predicted DCC family thiol-disulfide oxidoreductase YuxK
MRRLDKRERITFIDLTTPEAACPLDRQLMLARFHATTPDGKTVSCAAAFAAMWREIPLLRPLGLIAQNRVVLALLERTYTLFLRVRPLLQRLAR